MPYLLFTSYQNMWTLISLPLQMVERLLRAQPVSVANHVKACQSLIERAVMWLATESRWARSKRSAICSGKLCGGFIIFQAVLPLWWRHIMTSVFYEFGSCTHCFLGPLLGVHFSFRRDSKVTFRQCCYGLSTWQLLPTLSQHFQITEA